MHSLITPSLPAASFGELLTLAEQLRDTAPMLQVDIVDGVFAPHTSWPFTEADPKTALCELSTIVSYISLEVDCMVSNPEQYVETLIDAGVVSVIIHFGSTESYAALSELVRSSGCRIGLALTNDADRAEVLKLVPLFDFVQVMGIREVGAQGQPFDERTLDTLALLRTAFPELPLCVDGAVNHDTIPLLKRAGADCFAPGSAIAKAADPRAAYEQLAALATK